MDTIYKGRLPVAEVKLTNAELAAIAGFPDSASRTTLLSAVAAGEALIDAEITGLASWRTGFVSANTVGGHGQKPGFFG